MNGMLATDYYSFKRSVQEVTMASKSSVKIFDDQGQVDPQLLIQRLIIMPVNSQHEGLFQYELCTYPTVIFLSPFMLRQPHQTKTQRKGNIPYALDRGALLYRVPLPKGSPTK